MSVPNVMARSGGALFDSSRLRGPLCPHVSASIPACSAASCHTPRATSRCGTTVIRAPPPAGVSSVRRGCATSASLSVPNTCDVSSEVASPCTTGRPPRASSGGAVIASMPPRPFEGMTRGATPLAVASSEAPSSGRSRTAPDVTTAVIALPVTVSPMAATSASSRRDVVSSVARRAAKARARRASSRREYGRCPAIAPAMERRASSRSTSSYTGSSAATVAAGCAAARCATAGRIAAARTTTRRHRREGRLGGGGRGRERELGGWCTPKPNGRHQAPARGAGAVARLRQLAAL